MNLTSLFHSPVFLWLGLMILFLIIEIITVGLTSIWFAGGSLAALVADLLGLPFLWQAILFFAVSFILLFLTRPFALKFVKPHNIKTNYEELIGKSVRVTGRIDNREECGTAVCNGQEWTARSVSDDIVIEAGETATVVAIKGVKLIVKK